MAAMVDENSWFTPTEQESAWGQEIKAAADEAGVQYHSDFELAQMAIGEWCRFRKQSLPELRGGH